MDIINAYFRRFYPLEIDRRSPEQWRFGEYRGGGWEYEGLGREHRIFPAMLCKDGFRLSVQGHYGAHSCPSEDFSEDPYRNVEILGPAGIPEFKPYEGHDFEDGRRIYDDVPVALVAQVITQHGGLFDWNAADLGATP